MIYRVVFRPEAAADLLKLYTYVAAQSGREVAGHYVDRIEAACLALAQFPKRGTMRNDLRPGLRIIGFERRAVIAFHVGDEIVTIVGIFPGGRDYERALRLVPRD